jgi:hypothetical protein
MDTINLGKSDGLTAVEWTSVVQQLDTGVAPAADDGAANRHTTWLTTVNEDGSPHTTAVGALWLDGTFWFQTGKATRKARNVGRDPRCSVAVSVRDGDVVVDGHATRVTDAATVARVAQAFADQGWPAEVHESGDGITAPYNAPALGAPPWHVYKIELDSATVVSTVEPGGSTRFRF